MTESLTFRGKFPEEVERKLWRRSKDGTARSRKSARANKIGDSMKKDKAKRVIGEDNYENKAWLDMQRDGSKLKIYSSEEGGPVVLSIREAKKLVEVLQKAIKECVKTV